MLRCINTWQTGQGYSLYAFTKDCFLIIENCLIVTPLQSQITYCHNKINISRDKTWSMGKGNGKPLQYSCLENPRSRMKRQKDMTPEDELPRSVGVQCAAGEEQRNSSRKQAKAEMMLSCGCVWWWKYWCCKEQYCIETRNVRFVNQGCWLLSCRKWQEWKSKS